MKNLRIAIFIIISVLIVDQALKIWIKTTLPLGGEIPVIGNWFSLYFVENNGMAFGLELEGNWGKLVLSIFRILAVSAIGYYLIISAKKQRHLGFIVSLALIFSGAVGNILDSAFYGLIFSESSYFHALPATLFPSEGGYAPFLYGKVVDMFHFKIWQGTYPDWFPFWGSQDFLFFRPVFNVADSAITIGVISLIIFQRNFFPSKKMT